MNILIMGYGKTGQALATQLVEAGHAVTAVSRSPQPSIKGIKHLCQDVRHFDLSQDILFDYVYVILAPDQRGVEFYQNAFVDPILPITRALKNHPISKIVFVSSTHVYGENQGGFVDDATIPHTNDPIGQCLIAAEQLWRAYWGDKLIVLRPSGLYQADSQYLVKQALNATEVKLKHWTNRIHREDFVSFLSYLITLQQPESAYILSDQLPSLQPEMWNSIREKNGLQPLAIQADLAHSGKRLIAGKFAASGYQLRYPTWKQGYPFASSDLK